MRRKADIWILFGMLFVASQLFILPVSFLFESLWWFAFVELVALAGSLLTTSLLVINNPEFNDYEGHDDADDN